MSCCVRPAYAANTPEQEAQAAAYYAAILNSNGIDLTVYDFHGNGEEMAAYIESHSVVDSKTQVVNNLIVLDNLLDSIGDYGHNRGEYPIVNYANRGGSDYVGFRYSLESTNYVAVADDNPLFDFWYYWDSYRQWMRYAISVGPAWTPSAGSGGGSGGGAESVDGVYYVDCIWAGFPTVPSVNSSVTTNIRVGAVYNSSTNTASSGTSTGYYVNRRQEIYSPVCPDVWQARLNASLIDFDIDSYDYLVVVSFSYNNDDADVFMYELPTGSYQINDSGAGATIVLNQSCRAFSLLFSSGVRPIKYMTDGTYYSCCNFLSSQFSLNAGTYKLNARLGVSSSACGYYGFVGGGSGGGDDGPGPVEPYPEQPSPGPDIEPLPDPGSFPDIPDEPQPTYTPNDTDTGNGQVESLLSLILDALRIINDNVITGSMAIGDGIYNFEQYIGDIYEDWVGRFRQYWSSIQNMVIGWLRPIEDDLEAIRTIARNIWNLLYQLRGDLEGLSGLVDGDGAVDIEPGSTPQEQLSSDMDSLKGKFPFSLPWDLYALLHLLDAPPQAPAWDVRIAVPYTGEDLRIQGDLEDFDPYMGAIRTFSLIMFGWGLAMITGKVVSW